MLNEPSWFLSRDEGLLAKPKSKTAGGMSFEVVDATVVQENVESQEDAFVSAKFIPKKKIERLESRREVRERKSAGKFEFLSEPSSAGEQSRA